MASPPPSQGVAGVWPSQPRLRRTCSRPFLVREVGPFSPGLKTDWKVRWKEESAAFGEGLVSSCITSPCAGLTQSWPNSEDRKWLRTTRKGSPGGGGWRQEGAMLLIRLARDCWVEEDVVSWRSCAARPWQCCLVGIAMAPCLERVCVCVCARSANVGEFAVLPPLVTRRVARLSNEGGNVHSDCLLLGAGDCLLPAVLCGARGCQPTGRKPGLLVLLLSG